MACEVAVCAVSDRAVPRAMNNGKYRNLLRQLIGGVDDEIGRLQEFARSFDQAGPSDMGKTSDRKPVDAGANAPEQSDRSRRIVL